MQLNELLVAGAAAGAILLIVLAVTASGSVDPVRLRLNQLGGDARNLEDLELRQPFLERTILPFTTRISGAVGRLASEGFTTRTARRLALAGNPGDISVGDWLAVKLIVSLLMGAGFFLLFAILSGPSFTSAVIGLAGFGIGFIGPEFWLGSRVRGRQHRILRALPDSLDLLTISVRAGLGFDAALAKVTESQPGPLSDEFRRALAEIRVGKQRRDALRDILPRTEVPALTNFVGAIIQAERLGVPIARVLQVQSEQLRIERRQRAEELAAQAPIKMLFPLVGCIFPSLFVVILGPAIILIAQNLH